MSAEFDLQCTEVDIHDFLAPYRDKKVYYCANLGNAGDALIAYSAFQIFNETGIDYEKIDSNSNIEDSIIFYAGGGNLTSYYSNCVNFLDNNLKKNKEIIVLPHTITGHEQFLRNSPSNLKIICREKYSYQYLISIFPYKDNISLSKDLAFYLDLAPFRHVQKPVSNKILNCFRKDVESTTVSVPEDNIDLSNAWASSDWRDPIYTEEVVRGLISYISTFQFVRTNRLHIAILSTLLGREVFLYPNSYFKNQAIFEHSLIEYKNVKFVDTSETSVLPEEILESTSTRNSSFESQDGFLENVSRYFELFENSKNFSQLRQFRSDVVRKLVGMPLADFCGAIATDYSKIYQSFLNSKIYYEALEPGEHILVDELRAKLATNIQNASSFQYLLLLSLYQKAFQLDIPLPVFDLIPDSLLHLVVKYLLDTPKVFKQEEEPKAYLSYLSDLTERFCTNIIKHQDSTVWKDIEYLFVKSSSFIHAYFSDENLKSLYFNRSQILENFLTRKGYSLELKPSDQEYSLVRRRKRIRVGFLCHSYNPRTETYSALPAFEYLDRNKFEIILFGIYMARNPILDYCSYCVDRLVQLPKRLIDQVEVIRSFELDFIFIGTNITAVTNEIALLSAHRLAAHQATLYSSPVTTGMSKIDYYISGKTTEKPYSSDQYSEKLVVLDGPGYCLNYTFSERSIADRRTLQRSDLYIPESSTIFISGANFYKIIPDVRNCWAEILSQVPDSYLVLYPFSPSWSSTYEANYFIQYFHEELACKDVELNRLVILNSLPNREAVKPYLELADIYLDSFPYTGSHSTFDALEANLPPIVFEGSNLRSRQGAALLREVDVPELIVSNKRSYIDLAVRLSKDRNLRVSCSSKIREALSNNPKFLDSKFYSAQIGDWIEGVFTESLRDKFLADFSLRRTNFIVFPDWSQPEETLIQDFTLVLQWLLEKPDQSNIALLIKLTNVAATDAELLISGVAIDMTMNADSQVDEFPEMTFVGELSEIEWDVLLRHVNCCLKFPNEDYRAIAQAGADKLLVKFI